MANRFHGLIKLRLQNETGLLFLCAKYVEGQAGVQTVEDHQYIVKKKLPGFSVLKATAKLLLSCVTF